MIETVGHIQVLDTSQSRDNPCCSTQEYPQIRVRSIISSLSFNSPTKCTIRVVDYFHYGSQICKAALKNSQTSTDISMSFGGKKDVGRHFAQYAFKLSIMYYLPSGLKPRAINLYFMQLYIYLKQCWFRL